MNLCNYLSTQPCFDDTSIAFMDQIFIRRRCVKQEQILTGEGSRDIYFVESGLLRLFFYTKRRDITREFYLENSFYVPIEHVFLNASFPYRLESVTNSVIRVADYDRVSSAVSKHTGIQEFAFSMMTRFIKSLSDRMYAVQFQNAGERYQALLKQHAEILQQASLGQIASYLGMTQQTLSTVRKAATVREA